MALPRISLDMVGRIFWIGGTEVAAILSWSFSKVTSATFKLGAKGQMWDHLPSFGAFIEWGIPWLCLMLPPFRRFVEASTVPNKLVVSVLVRAENGSSLAFFFIVPALLSFGSSESLWFKFSSDRFSFPLSRSWPFSRAALPDSVLVSWTGAPTPSLWWKSNA